MPAFVIGPVRGPRSASTSLNARVAGRGRAARGCVSRVEGELACISLRRGLAISRSYRPVHPDPPSHRKRLLTRALGDQRYRPTLGRIHTPVAVPNQ